MPKFNVFQQGEPTKVGTTVVHVTDRKSGTRVAKTVGTYIPNLQPLGEIIAPTGTMAIELAKTWPEFKQAKGLARFPIVEEIGRPRYDDSYWLSQ